MPRGSAVGICGSYWRLKKCRSEVRDVRFRNNGWQGSKSRIRRYHGLLFPAVVRTGIINDIIGSRSGVLIVGTGLSASVE